MPDQLVNLLSQLDFWRGLGRLGVDLVLIAAMYFVVMAISGHAVRLRRPQRRDSSASDGRKENDEPGGAGDHPEAKEAGAAVTDPVRVAHLDLLASLRHSLELQGATIVLIVFTVLLLGFNHIVSGAEVATILSGITGYVLGTRNQAPPRQQGTSDRS